MARPYVILNAAMTLDGKIATVAGDSKISCKRDLNRVHGLRASVDAVIVGVGTVLADNPLLTVRRAKGKNPVRVIVDGEARTPVDARVLDDSAKTIIAVTKRAPKRKLKELRAAGAEVIVIGNRKVNLRRLLKRLHSLRVRRLLLEGGSTINWGMLKQGLVDEVRVAVAPRIVGGVKAKSLVGGAGFAEVRNGIKLKLLNVKKIEKHILLTYRVWGAKGAKKAR
ncbi:2,5-diamino-6-ribosylamino-4(3H)-pyrimidinone 5'-phosphate reductase [subsurface metagenome]|nr:2,5-diamino-6-(ribosylamino)-4(3H)-pyrimidinone 5'-phosphate reductase [Hadesarchaea archaeon]